MSEFTESFVDGVEVHMVELEMFINDITEAINEVREKMETFSKTIERQELLETLKET